MGRGRKVKVGVTATSVVVKTEETEEVGESTPRGRGKRGNKKLGGVCSSEVKEEVGEQQQRRKRGRPRRSENKKAEEVSWTAGAVSGKVGEVSWKVGDVSCIVGPVGDQGVVVDEPVDEEKEGQNTKEVVPGRKNKGKKVRDGNKKQGQQQQQNSSNVTTSTSTKVNGIAVINHLTSILGSESTFGDVLAADFDVIELQNDGTEESDAIIMPGGKRRRKSGPGGRSSSGAANPTPSTSGGGGRSGKHHTTVRQSFTYSGISDWNFESDEPLTPEDLVGYEHIETLNSALLEAQGFRWDWECSS